ncbi:MAG: DNA-3-methyladenine glycosylase I, partial [Candidatus Eremiobacteraeota bacterium]|nr:DNA-3-methyladenine glycosylase I [Candidatus Eremiobacteraeota bacterium]
QAGLSWETVLRKRDRYRELFYGFDPRRVARITPARVEKVLADPGVVRNRLKVESTVSNARAFLKIQTEFGSFDRYVWPFVGGKPMVSPRKTIDGIPSVTPEAERLSADLKRRGFRYVGPTIVYAFMQATGLVNDHLSTCTIRGRAAG